MYLPESGFYSEFKWVEVAEFMPNLDPPRVIRHQKRKYENGEVVERIPILYKYPAKEFFKDKEVGLYTSIWRRKTSYIPDKPHPILAPLYFDLDSDEIEKSYEEAVRLYRYLRRVVPDTAILAYFTGKKGFHIEVNPIAFNAAPSTTLPEVYKFISDHIAKELELTTMDTAVRDSRRMWRLPNSKHQSTGLYKVWLPMTLLIEPSLKLVLDIAKEPGLLPDTTVEFNMEAAQWFRDFQTKYEDSCDNILSLEDRIKRFERFGSYKNIDFNNLEREFNPIAVFEGTCTFIRDMMIKAEREHDLSHSERLALCSLLSFDEQSLEYLYYILSQCTDYSEQKSQFHISDWIRRREQNKGGRPMSCKWLKENNISCGQCDKLESRNRFIRSGDTLYQTDEEALASPIRNLYKKKSI